MVGKGKFSHFLHEHILIYRSANDETTERKLCCELCDEAIDKGGPYPYFCCEWCPDFALHNWCAHKSDEILHHPLHPQHKLELRHVDDMNLESHLVCEECSFPLKMGYGYVCFECDFFFHMSCLPSTMNRRSNRSKKVRLKHACHPEHGLVLYQAEDIDKQRHMFLYKCCWCEKSVTHCSVHEAVYACLY